MAAAVALLSLAGFALLAVVEVQLLVDPSPFLARLGGASGALMGVGLLAADVVLPVPSSLVMVAHGALFGLVGGAVLSLAGRVAAAATGAAIGRGFGRRWLPGDGGKARGERLVQRWGPLAVVVTRPVPVLAESVTVAAGAAGMPWSLLVVATLVGALPEAVLYAAAGATAATFNNAALVFLVVLALPGAAWAFWGRRREVAQ